MAKILSASHALARSLRRRALHGVSAATALVLSLPVEVLAQDAASGSGNRHFTAAPVPKADSASEADMILGIPANTIFFAAVVVIGLFWFTLGGGRKAKLDRPQ